MKSLMILASNSNYITFIILNVIFIGIATIIIMLFISEKERKLERKLEKRLNDIEEEVQRRNRRPRGKIEKESND